MRALWWDELGFHKLYGRLGRFGWAGLEFWEHSFFVFFIVAASERAVMNGWMDG